MRTLITNGTVVNADGSYRADVLIEDETIAAVGLIGDESIMVSATCVRVPVFY